MADNPLPAIMGRVCYRPCETACNRAAARRRRSASTRSSGSSATRPSGKAGPCPTRPRRPASRVLVVGAGPSGLSAAYHLAPARPPGHDPRLRAGARRHDALRHPGLPAAARRARRRDRPDPGAGRAAGGRADGHRHHRRRWRDGGFDAAFLAVGAQAGKRAYIPAGDSARILDAVRYLHEVAEGEPPQLGRRVVVYGGGNTAMDAARTARRLGATDAIVVYRRTRDRMPAHDSRGRARPPTRASRMTLAVHHRRGRRRQALIIEKMRLDETGFPQPTGEFEELAADTVVLALGQEAELVACSTACPASTIDDGVGPGRPDHDDRPRRASSPAATWSPSERTVTVGHRPRQEGRQQHRRLAARPGPGRPRRHRARSCATFGPAQHLVLRRRAGHRPAAAGGRPPGHHLRRGDRRPGRVERAVRGPPLPVLRQLLRVRQLLRRLPGQRGDQARVLASRYEIDLDYCKGCGICAAECPCGAIDMVPERDLSARGTGRGGPGAAPAPRAP